MHAETAFGIVNIKAVLLAEKRENTYVQPTHEEQRKRHKVFYYNNERLVVEIYRRLYTVMVGGSNSLNLRPVSIYIGYAREIRNFAFRFTQASK